MNIINGIICLFLKFHLNIFNVTSAQQSYCNIFSSPCVSCSSLVRCFLLHKQCTDTGKIIHQDFNDLIFLKVLGKLVI